VEESTLLAAVRETDVVLLGEKHDNPDHHHLQAEVVRALADAGHAARVSLEMLDEDQQPAVDALVASGVTAENFGPRVTWEERGWPAWPMYAPIVEVALAKHLPIVAANAPLEIIRKIAHGGDAALDLPRQMRVAAVAFSAAEEAALEREMNEAHCGHLPAKMAPNMALAQRARDATMAGTLTGSGAVLVCGAEHARRDRGVPRYVLAARPDAKIVSIGFTEVLPDKATPSAYWEGAEEPAAFDFVWFTPRFSDDDPCAKFRLPHK
jgi:uncharacterized iron-regulated protein